jgi:hypothetical protein
MELTPEELDKMPPDVRARYDAAQQELMAMSGQAPAPDGETAEADPVQEAETPTAEIVELGESSAEAAPAPEPEPAPAPAADERVAHLEQAFKTLQGKYSAEVPRYAEQLRDRDRELAEMRRELAEMKARAETKPVKPADRKAKYELTDDQVETYGEELLEVIERVADRKAEEKLAQTVRPIEQRLEGSAREAFAARLAAMVPDMEAVNADPAFAEWLGETDPFSGKSRRELADAAIAAMDAPRTARFFTAFLEQSKPVQAAAPSAPVAPPRPATPSLAAQVMPRPSAPLPQAPAKSVYTAAQFMQAMTDIGKGRYSDQEAAQIKAEFDAAYREGRIRP